MPSDVEARAPTVEELERELAEARDQQTATSEILRVISISPSNAQPVFAEIAKSSARLCDAYDAIILLKDGDLLRHAAHEGPIPIAGQLTLQRGSFMGRAVLEHRTIHVADLQAEVDEYPLGSEIARRLGHRTMLAVPLMRAGKAIGVIALRRLEKRPFSERQIELLRTFADQAVIAIENTRLFEAEKTRTRDLTERTQELAQRSKELTEALQYQTVTNDVLGVIAASPTDIQPVLRTLVESACRLCAAYDGIILLRDGDWLQVKAHYGPILANVAKRKITRDWVNGRCVADRVQIHVQDLQAEVAEYPEGAALAQRLGARTILSTPLMREGEAIGAIMIRRDEVRPFSDKQIGLLETFARQAVIAIENTRLFDAEQASKRELTESLEYQTAISEVLGVISRSPTDAQPVFQSIAQSAAQLCGAQHCNVYRFDGRLIYFAATHLVPGMPHEAREANMRQPPIAPGRGNAAARSIAYGTVAEIPDIDADPDYERRDVTGVSNLHSTMAVPMLKDGRPIGAIVVSRSEKGRFSDRQIDLLKTFADQAVIAIENTRLFEEVQTRTKELTESLKYQTAISDVLGVINRSKFDLSPVLGTIARVASSLCADDVVIQLKDGEDLRAAAHHGTIPLGEVPNTRRPIGRGWVSGRAVVDRRPIHVLDLASAGDEFPLGQDLAKKFGHRTTLAIPLLREEEAVGCLMLRRLAVQSFSENQIALLQTFADQAVIAIENTRLFEEIARKSRELEIASQHKSQFVANMSHELRTPLAAILGYAELMQEGFYEAQGPKSLDALTRIRSNGKHLLGLINTVLDIAKIESGQFTLNMGEYAIESVVETVRVATESLAQNKKLALKTEVAKSLPIGLGDEQRLTQVLLNLVGNAIKFTDTGEVRVTAKAVNGHFNVSVTDTGPGIPLEHQARIFEQFHQVDSSNTKAKGGTGLGLAIAKQIVEMHGGRIWVESTLGKGSIFQMQFPTRAELQKRAP